MIPQDAVRTAVLQATVQSMTDVLQYTIHKIERNRCANLRIALIQVKSSQEARWMIGQAVVELKNH